MVQFDWVFGGKYQEGSGFISDILFVNSAICKRRSFYSCSELPWMHGRIDVYGLSMCSRIKHSSVGPARFSKNLDSVSVRIEVSEDLMLEPDMVRRIRFASLLVTSAEKVNRLVVERVAVGKGYPILTIMTDTCLEYMSLPSPLPDMYEMRRLLGRPQESI